MAKRLQQRGDRLQRDPDRVRRRGLVLNCTYDCRALFLGGCMRQRPTTSNQGSVEIWKALSRSCICRNCPHQVSDTNSSHPPGFKKAESVCSQKPGPTSLFRAYSRLLFRCGSLQACGGCPGAKSLTWGAACEAKERFRLLGIKHFASTSAACRSPAHRNKG